MDSAITTQPIASKPIGFEPLISDVPQATAPMPEMEKLQPDEQETKKKDERVGEIIDETADCCFQLSHDDCLSAFFCCRFLSQCLVGCGECTESCCEGCCECLCNCENNQDTNGAGDCCTCCVESLSCCDGCDCDCSD